MGNNEGSGFDNEKGESVSIGSRESNKINIQRTGGLLLTVMEELIKVGKTMGYNMKGSLNPKAKKDWVKEICVSHKVNSLTLQETKMEDISLLMLNVVGVTMLLSLNPKAKKDWVKEICVSHKVNSLTLQETKMEDIYLLMLNVVGVTMLLSMCIVRRGVNLLIISVYAPQEYAKKKMLWDYLVHVISKWDGE
nr:RNA-directed DNA polymerase, eukaryota [Tanacetum cinerariifolium]